MLGNPAAKADKGDIQVGDEMYEVKAGAGSVGGRFNSDKVTTALGGWKAWDKGLGEIAIALGFGPVMVMGAHYALTSPLHNNNLSSWNWVEALIASVPIGILVMLIVWINQFQDAPSDAAVGKNTWVVRTAVEDGWMRLEKPLSLYKQFMIEAFIAVGVIGVISFFTDYGTVYAFIALLPVILVWKAFKMADEWMIKWNNPDADRQKVPYELLLVNVSTIGIHFLTGILLSVAYIL